MKHVLKCIWRPLVFVVGVLAMPRAGVTFAGEAAKGGDSADAKSTTGPVGPRSQPSPDYRLTPSDLVDVEMFNQAEIRASQRLTANGEVRLPLIGRVVLQGLTVREAEQHIEQLFREGGFFVDPQVIISVKEYSDRGIAILGQVNSPSRIPLLPEVNSIGIVEALTLVGGFTRIARTDAVQVTRTGKDGLRETTVVNVQELLRTRRPGEQREFQLLAGDVVFVPERAF